MNSINKNGLTPLHIMCSDGNLEVVKNLLDRGACITVSDNDGRTPLHIACFKGHYDLVKELLERGADLSVSDKYGMTPLHVACSEGHTEICVELLSKGANTANLDLRGRSPLCIASSKGYAQIVKELVSRGVELNSTDKDGLTPLYLACAKNHADVVQELIAHGADFQLKDRDGRTPFDIACHKGHVMVVLELINGGININYTNNDGMTALHIACHKGYLFLVYELLNRGADINCVNKEGMTPLYIACTKRFLEIARALLQSGADINRTNSDGNTPLYMACSNDYIEIVTDLLAKKADMTIFSRKNGLGPLHIACCKGHVQVLRELLTNGADINIISKNGMTPLYGACLEGHLDIVKELLLHGANINIINKKNGMTPLHIASMKGYIDITKELLKHNTVVVLTQGDRNGDTALSHACRGQYMEIIHNILKIYKLNYTIQNCRSDINRSLSLLTKVNQLEYDVLIDSMLLILDDDPMKAAIKYGLYTQVKRLIGFRANTPEDIEQLLLYVIELKDQFLIEYFIELYASPCTILIMGITFDFQQLIQKINNNSVLDFFYRIKKSKSLYPIHHSLRSGIFSDEYLINLITDQYDTLQRIDYYGMSAWMVADTIGASEEVRFHLLSNLCKMILRTPFGSKNAPLHCVRNIDHVKCLQLRLNYNIQKAKIYFEIHLDSNIDNMKIKFGTIIIEYLNSCFYVNTGLTKKMCHEKLLLKSGDIVGLGFNTNNNHHYQNGIDEWLLLTLNGALLTLDVGSSTISSSNTAAVNASSNIHKDVFVCPEIQLDSDQGISINFGQRPYVFVPKCGYVSLYEYLNKRYLLNLEYFDDIKNTWLLLTPSTGILVYYYYDWVDIFQDNKYNQIIRKVLFGYPDKARQLINQYDAYGKQIIDLASTDCKKIIYEIISFMNKYLLDYDEIEYKSDSSIVLKGSDINTNRRVAIKLMKDEISYQKEILVRNKLLNKYIISTIESFEVNVKNQFKYSADNLGLCDYNYAIAMPLATRNLHSILIQERISGRDWDKIKHIFHEIVQCVGHMHSCGFVHGDIKPLNIVRNHHGHMVLIDFDATVSYVEGDYVGYRYSSAYCPPEFTDYDENLDTVNLRCILNNIELTSRPDYYLLASPSFDMWSLGVLLYQLCAKEPLFLCDDDDNLDSLALRDLYEWTDEFKTEKLYKIDNLLARNLVSRLLNKDPRKRPTASSILLHPFLCDSTMTRTTSREKTYDVFLSYREASDENLAMLLYEHLTVLGFKIWLDQKCLEPGEEWRDNFFSGMISSHCFICLMSRAGIDHPIVDKQNFSRLQSDSECDKILLEYILALELYEMGLIEKIFPIMIGDLQDNGYNSFDFKILDKLRDISVQAVESELYDCLKKENLGYPLIGVRTVRGILDMIFQYPGVLIEGESTVAVSNTLHYVHNVLLALQKKSNEINLKSNVQDMNDSDAVANLETNVRINEGNDDRTDNIEVFKSSKASQSNEALSKSKYNINRKKALISLLQFKDDIQREIDNLIAEGYTSVEDEDLNVKVVPALVTE